MRYISAFLLCLTLLSSPLQAAEPTGQRLILYPEPSQAQLVSEYCIARLKLSDLTQDLYHGLKLSISNISQEPLVIDFNNIWYTFDGQRFGGVVLSELTGLGQSKPAYAIEPGQTYTKNLWPQRLSVYKGGWEHSPLPVGEHGLIFILRQGELSIQGSLSLHLKKTYAPIQ